MKKSKLLLISSIIGILLFTYIFLSFFLSFFLDDTTYSKSFIKFISYLIKNAIILPHIILSFIALIFNWIGYFLNLRWCALVSGIIYCISMILMPLYAYFVIIQTILSFIAFAKMKNIKNNI